MGNCITDKTEFGAATEKNNAMVKQDKNSERAMNPVDSAKAIRKTNNIEKMVESTTKEHLVEIKAAENYGRATTTDTTKRVSTTIDNYPPIVKEEEDTLGANVHEKSCDWKLHVHSRSEEESCLIRHRVASGYDEYLKRDPHGHRLVMSNLYKDDPTFRFVVTIYTGTVHSKTPASDDSQTRTLITVKCQRVDTDGDTQVYVAMNNYKDTIELQRHEGVACDHGYLLNVGEDVIMRYSKIDEGDLLCTHADDSVKYLAYDHIACKLSPRVCNEDRLAYETDIHFEFQKSIQPDLKQHDAPLKTNSEIKAQTVQDYRKKNTAVYNVPDSDDGKKTIGVHCGSTIEELEDEQDVVTAPSSNVRLSRKKRVKRSAVRMWTRATRFITTK